MATRIDNNKKFLIIIKLTPKEAIDKCQFGGRYKNNTELICDDCNKDIKNE